MKIEIKINIYYIKLINNLTYILLYFIIHFIFIILLYTITILFFLWPPLPPPFSGARRAREENASYLY